MIDALTDLFKSMTKALDVLYVIEGVKDVSRIMADESQLDDYKTFFNKNNLSFAVSDFKISKEIDENRFSNKGIRLPINEKGSYFVYISKSKEKAEQAKKAEAESNHKELGKLLGYPDCCINFFEKNFPIESKKKNDYVLASLKNSKGFIFPFYNNVAIRHLDLSLLSHFPCSLNCEESIKIAKNNLKIIEKHSKDISRIFEGMLRSAVLYTEDEGIFVLREFKLENDYLSYNSIMSEANNETYKKLKQAEKIEIIDKNTINIHNDKMKNIGIMVFL